MITYDEVKNIKNLTKHKVSFKTAAVLKETDSNPDVWYDEKHSDAYENRYRGTFRWNDHYLFIVYAESQETIRIISARLATKDEVKRYYQRGE